MTFRAMAVSISFLMSASTMSFAQVMERPKDVEPGDKAIYNWVLNNKKMVVEEVFTDSTDTEIIGVQRVNEEEHPYVISRATNSPRQSMCYSNGQSCEFSESARFLEFPLVKGKKWETEFDVKGKTFRSNVKASFKVEKVEKVNTPAGQYETWRISHKGRINGRDGSGNAFSGTENGEFWVATVNGKLIVVKNEYRNSFKERFTRELVTFSLQ